MYRRKQKTTKKMKEEEILIIFRVIRIFQKDWNCTSIRGGMRNFFWKDWLFFELLTLKKKETRNNKEQEKGRRKKLEQGKLFSKLLTLRKTMKKKKIPRNKREEEKIIFRLIDIFQKYRIRTLIIKEKESKKKNLNKVNYFPSYWHWRRRKKWKQQRTRKEKKYYFPTYFSFPERSKLYIINKKNKK